MSHRTRKRKLKTKVTQAELYNLIWNYKTSF